MFAPPYGRKTKGLVHMDLAWVKRPRSHLAATFPALNPIAATYYMKRLRSRLSATSPELPAPTATHYDKNKNHTKHWEQSCSPAQGSHLSVTSPAPDCSPPPATRGYREPSRQGAPKPARAPQQERQLGQPRSPKAVPQQDDPEPGARHPPRKLRASGTPEPPTSGPPTPPCPNKSDSGEWRHRPPRDVPTRRNDSSGRNDRLPPSIDDEYAPPQGSGSTEGAGAKQLHPQHPPAHLDTTRGYSFARRCHRATHPHRAPGRAPRSPDLSDPNIPGRASPQRHQGAADIFPRSDSLPHSPTDPKIHGFLGREITTSSRSAKTPRMRPARRSAFSPVFPPGICKSKPPVAVNLMFSGKMPSSSKLMHSPASRKISAYDLLSPTEVTCTAAELGCRSRLGTLLFRITDLGRGTSARPPRGPMPPTPPAAKLATDRDGDPTPEKETTLLAPRPRLPRTGVERTGETSLTGRAAAEDPTSSPRETKEDLRDSIARLRPSTAPATRFSMRRSTRASSCWCGSSSPRSIPHEVLQISAAVLPSEGCPFSETTAPPGSSDPCIITRLRAAVFLFLRGASFSPEEGESAATLLFASNSS
ncbi:serine/arginine repetitive matrix protein 1-like [Nylanderia fulva]|uniref:serine/arginine repetitive matrix protein 1-like n=1 Tax=Nylanderia fulva TaxID=613905 RepID=UPI0010FB2FBA|nr:serine/arginine repetitive matrix protein 1-like [Nylanderia fulva]